LYARSLNLKNFIWKNPTIEGLNEVFTKGTVMTSRLKFFCPLIALMTRGVLGRKEESEILDVLFCLPNQDLKEGK